MMLIRFFVLLALTFAPVLAPVAMAASDSKAPVTAHTTVPEEATSHEDPAGPAFVTGEAQAPHEAAEEHGEGGLPQLNFGTYASQAFWLMVMFTILYLTFSKMTLPSIGAVIEAREGKIQGDLDAAEAMRAQAEDIRTAYEKGLEQARAQATAAIQDVEIASKKKASDRTDAFRKKSETDILAAESRMDDVRIKAMGEMTAVAAEVAGLAAEKITGVSTDAQKAKAIVETIAGKAKAA